MTVVCCVCKKVIGEKPGKEGLVSHSYCEKCHKEALAEIKKLKAMKGLNQ